MPDQTTIDVSNVVVEVDPRSLVTLAIGKEALADKNGTFKSERPAALGQTHRHGPRPVTVTYEVVAMSRGKGCSPCFSRLRIKEMRVEG